MFFLYTCAPRAGGLEGLKLERALQGLRISINVLILKSANTIHNPQFTIHCLIVRVAAPAGCGIDSLFQSDQ